jgi:hypothetical protein
MYSQRHPRLFVDIPDAGDLVAASCGMAVFQFMWPVKPDARSASTYAG